MSVKNIFLVLGYGVPKDIFKDENYNFYLQIVFNKIYDIIRQRAAESLIICSGGKTDIRKPYSRTEAGEIIRFLKKLAGRPLIKIITKDWYFVPEKKSFSTLENLLGCQEILQKKKAQRANLYIFCEQTRAKRVTLLAVKIFGRQHKLQIIPIDFDISANRYLDQKFLARKERVELKHALWALQSRKNLEKHHQIFKERIDYLRKVGRHSHVDAVKQWWQDKINSLPR